MRAEQAFALCGAAGRPLPFRELSFLGLFAFGAAPVAAQLTQVLVYLALLEPGDGAASDLHFARRAPGNHSIHF